MEKHHHHHKLEVQHLHLIQLVDQYLLLEGRQLQLRNQPPQLEKAHLLPKEDQQLQEVKQLRLMEGQLLNQEARQAHLEGQQPHQEEQHLLQP
jgi:hypothetical protein